MVPAACACAKRVLWVLLLAGWAGSVRCDRAESDVTAQSVVWTDLLPEPGLQPSGGSAPPTLTYHNSMPIGNGHIAANVNFDSSNNSLAVLLSAASSWSEAGEPLKVALLTVSLPDRGGALLGPHFSQRFNPQDATVRLTIPAGGKAPEMEVIVYADASNDSVVISVSPPCKEVTARLQRLRPAPTERSPFVCVTYSISADVTAGDGSMVYHRNELPPSQSYMETAFKVLNIPKVAGFNDPLMNRSTGVMLARLPTDNSKITFTATVLTAQTSTASEFEQKLAAASLAFGATTQRSATLPAPSHMKWWAAKWSEHYIKISSPGLDASNAARVTQMYTLQRFIELSQARSPYPIKFNGMLYSAHRPGSKIDDNTWGGLNWWQNIRLSYYNMLPAGDADELTSLFASFVRTLPIARARTRAYFGFDGVWWPEYTTVFYGTPHPSSPARYYGYAAGPGCTRQFPGEPVWHSDDTWNGYNRQGSLDLSLMILDHASYTGQYNPEYLTIPIEVVQFYANLWGNTTTTGSPSGTMIFYPTQALETWQCPGWPVNTSDCPTNDMPTVAGLHAVLEKLMQLPPTVVTTSQKNTWRVLVARLPPLPTINGAFAACDNCIIGGTGPGCHKVSNGENAGLYSVHPYRRATIARGDQTALKLARAAWKTRLDPMDKGWNQCAMDAALLGNTSAAVDLVIARALTAPAPGYRFPAFAPREQDAAPSADHFAVFQNALQYMLVQRVDDDADSVLLLPAWPCNWDVNFSVSAPRQTKITGQLYNGHLKYSVIPADRASAVRAAECQPIKPVPPQTKCNMTVWKRLCTPNPHDVNQCMSCCERNQAELWKLQCIGPDCWPDFCAEKPAPGCGH